MERPSDGSWGAAGMGVEEGGCGGSRDPPEGLSMSCLESLHVVDFTAVILIGKIFITHWVHEPAGTISASDNHHSMSVQ